MVKLSIVFEQMQDLFVTPDFGILITAITDYDEIIF